MADEEERLLNFYHDDIRRIDVEFQNSTTVLYCCVLAVVNHHSRNDSEMLRKNHSIAPVTDIFSASGEFISLQTLGSSGSFQGLVQEVYHAPTIEDDIIAVECDDSSTIKLARGVPCLPSVSNNNTNEYTSASVAGLVLFEKHALVRGQIWNILAGKQFPLKPAMTSTERGIMETELLSFTSLSATDLYRNDQLRAAGEMLQAHIKELPNFTGTLMAGGEETAITRRRYFRHVSPQIFAQILSAERVREPVVVKQYYPLTDDLLLALHWPPPERRTRKETWAWSGPIPVDSAAVAAAAAAAVNAKSAKSRKGKVESVKKPAKRGSKKGTEETAAATVGCIVSTTTLTPAAHSIALIKRASTDHHSAVAWLTIHVNNAVLGLRMETCSLLTADFLAEQEHESVRDARSLRSAASHKSLLPEDGDAGSPVLSRAASQGQVPQAESTDQDLDNVGSSPSPSRLAGVSSTASLGQQEPPRGVFFCDAEDDVRFSVCAGPSSQPNRKPDGFGTICLIATYPDTMSVTLCSNGTTRITLPQQTAGASAAPQVAGGPVGLSAKTSTAVFDTAVGVETERFIGAGGTVMSLYSRASPSYLTADGTSVQFAKEIREADGSRLLIVRQTRGAVSSLAKAFSAATVTDDGRMTRTDSAITTASVVTTAAAATVKPVKGIQGFYQSLCSGGPEGWTCVKLSADGQVLFHTCPPDSALLENAPGVPHPTLHNATGTTVLDAETKSAVATFPDGRILVYHADGRRESKFGDGTVITTHSEGAMVSIAKAGLPSVEVDAEIDAVSRQHAKGIEVPINKGGERVRSRIALPDGTAVLVKYDTRLTTTTNGSIKVVRRDKTVMLLKDSGVVTYRPRAAWNAKAAAEFAAECADLPKPPPPISRAVRIANSRSTASLPTAGATGTLGGGDAQSLLGSPTSRMGSATVAGSTTGLSTAKATASRQKTVAAPGLVRRRTSPPRGRTGVATTAAGELAGVDKGTEKEDDTTFTFDILKFTCRILDYEFNSFDISLASEDPLNPGVVLSGEVEGLKPPAVADKPMEPRLFVVNRAAEATEVLSPTQVASLETLLRTCPDVQKVVSSVHLQPSELGPATMSKYFIQRRLLGARGDAFSFEEVFGERYWYPHGAPAAALLAEHNNRLAILKRRKRSTAAAMQAAIPPAARYFETISVVEQLPLSQAGHVELQRSIQQCDAFRANRLQSIDRFKVEEDRSREELDEEEALAKRLKLAFKAAKVAVAKKRELRAKQAAAAAAVPEEDPVHQPATGPSSPLLRHDTAMIPEGANEDEEEDDLNYPGDEEEPKELDPEEVEVRDTFEDFAVQHASHEEEALTIPKECLQDAFIRLFNRFVATDFVEREIDLCEECDASFEELTYVEFKALYYSMKASFAALDEAGHEGPLRVSTFEPAFLASHSSDDHSTHSSPTYWQSAQGQKVMKSLPAAAPPLDFRKLGWAKGDQGSMRGLFPGSADGLDEPDQEGAEEVTSPRGGRMVSTAHPAVGSALQAARMNSFNRAVTAPE